MVKVVSDFVVDSKDRCFFCLERIATNPSPLNESTLELATLNSLQYFSRFLRLDMRKVFIEKEDIPPHLMAKVEMSRLKVHLCSGCASLNEIFSSMCRRLEKMEMEVVSSLEDIYKKLIKGEEGTNDGFQKIMYSMIKESEYEWIGKFSILKVLRKDALTKCSNKIRNARPKITVQNLTEEDILKEKHKYIHSSRRSRSSKSTSAGKICSDSLSNSLSQLQPGILPEDGQFGSSTHHSRIKTEVEESIPEQWSDDQDGVYEDQQMNFEPEKRCKPDLETVAMSNITKREPRGPSHRKTGRRQTQQLFPNDAAINKNVEVVPGTGSGSGQKKYRCGLCRQLFSSKANATRHIKSTHLKLREFRCAQCSKAFSERLNLKIHMYRHSDFRPHPCHLCPKAFFKSTYLRTHLLVHSGSRSHKCKLCDKAYFRGSELNKHTRLHHQC